MTLKIWNTGENVQHQDLNGNFATHDNSISMLNASSVANAAAISAATSSAASNFAITAQNPAVADMAMANHKVTNLAQGVASTDAARLDQVGWVQIGSAIAASGLNAVGFPLPTAYYKFRLEWTNLSGNTASGILMSRLSMNNGSSYDMSANYWFGVSVRVLGGTESYSTSTNATYIPLTNGQSGQQVSEGFVEYSPSSGKGLIANAIGASSSFSEVEGMIHYPQGLANGIVIGLTGNTFTGGTVRLLGWKI